MDTFIFKIKKDLCIYDELCFHLKNKGMYMFFLQSNETQNKQHNPYALTTPTFAWWPWQQPPPWIYTEGLPSSYVRLTITSTFVLYLGRAHVLEEVRWSNMAIYTSNTNSLFMGFHLNFRIIRAYSFLIVNAFILL